MKGGALCTTKSRASSGPRSPSHPALRGQGPRVRKELRQLSNAQREKVKTTRQEDGLKRYGAHFVNYDLMVLAHVRAATHPTCDQGHNGPAFLTFHRALSVWVETSLVAIDPEIHGLPYWDYNLDFDNDSNPREAIMWSDDWFGEANGDESDMNMIRTGRFKHWQVRDNATALFAEFPVHHDASVQTPDILQYLTISAEDQQTSNTHHESSGRTRPVATTHNSRHICHKETLAKLC